jgi:hypothetical protein
MTGQIPKYGKNFKWERIGYHPTLAQRAYVLKIDEDWFIRSDKTSKQWTVFYGSDRNTAIAMGKVQPTLTAAMSLLLDGIDFGYYAVKSRIETVRELVKALLEEDEYWRYDYKIVVKPTSNPDQFTFMVTGYGVDRGCAIFRGGKPDVWFHDEDTMSECEVCGWKAADAATKPIVHASDCGLQGSGLDKRCTCS